MTAELGTIDDVQRVKAAEAEAARAVAEAQAAADAAVKRAREETDAVLKAAKAAAEERRAAAVRKARAGADEEAARLVAEGTRAAADARRGSGPRPGDRAREILDAVLGPLRPD